ncbi:MAG: Crp/Fnr family transcriptional regulator [Candidatus Promineifilaceae bacterium]
MKAWQLLKTQLHIETVAVGTKVCMESTERRFFMQKIVKADSYTSDLLTLTLPFAADSRVANLLLTIDKDVSPNPIACGHELIGAMLNLNRESISVILGRFRHAGLVELGYRRIRLRDRQALQRLAMMC